MQDNTVTGNTTLYIEKKALELLESCQDPETDFPQIFYLLGREYHLGIQRVFVIRSILEGPIQEDKDLHVTPEELRSVDQQRSLQYPGLRLMGWALHQPGQGVRAFSRHSRCHVQFFRQTSILLLKDSLNNTQDFYLWDGSSFHLINNYQIYKEQELDLDLTDEARPVELWKETPVQNESMLARAMRDNPPASKPLHFFNEETPDFLRHYTQKKPSPHYHSKEPRQFEGQLQSIVDPPPSKKTLKEKLKEDSHSFQLLTSISAIVLFITIIMGVLMFRNLSTLSSIQTNIETINDRISYIEQSEIVMEETDEE